LCVTGRATRQTVPYSVGRLNLFAEIKVGISICRCGNGAMPQLFLDGFQVYFACIEQACAAMPLRYNNNKRKNLDFQGVSAFVAVYSIPFPKLKYGEKIDEKRRLSGKGR